MCNVEEALRSTKVRLKNSGIDPTPFQMYCPITRRFLNGTEQNLSPILHRGHLERNTLYE